MTSRFYFSRFYQRLASIIICRKREHSISYIVTLRIRVLKMKVTHFRPWPTRWPHSLPFIPVYYSILHLHLSSSLSGLSPFVGADDFETMTNVSVAKYSFDYQPFDEISDQAKDFIEKLLVKETSKRLTAKNSLNHEWLLHCTKTNPERDITLSLTKTKLKRYVILRRLVESSLS